MKKIVLTILDGVGIRKEIHGNAFKQAEKPMFDFLWNNYPHSLLEASGPEVGLPEGQMGNSEVGHSNIGAGRIIYQPLQLINKGIKDETIFSNNELLSVIEHVKKNNSKLHIVGLVSDGGVHSHINHCIALLKFAKEHNIDNLYFHVITDGRDTLPDISYRYIKELEDNINKCGIGKIASIVGRYYAMDRDNRWDRTKKAYDMMTQTIGKHYINSMDAINDNNSNGVYDEFIEPCVLDESGKIEHNDGIIWFNFRPDRATQILESITNPEFKEFDTKTINNLKLVTIMPVSDKAISTSIFKYDRITNTFGEYISKFGLKQLRIAETEKYPHVTYFFDGMLENDIDGCDKILINSSKVATYDMKPEMSCNEITDSLLNNIEKYDVVILNYANGDMVGHTGNIPAAIKSIEYVDKNLKRLYDKVQELGYLLIVTADHGNCEYMLDENNNVITAHTTNKVPLIICDNKYVVKDGKLGDIAPTMLKIMGIDIPKEMDGNILIEYK